MYASLKENHLGGKFQEETLTMIREFNCISKAWSNNTKGSTGKCCASNLKNEWTIYTEMHISIIN